MKRLFALPILAAALFVTSCTTGNNASVGGNTRLNQEGWIDNDTYVLVVVGGWNREMYYIEGTEAKAGAKPKSAIMLEDDAKRAAQVKAMRNFLEKVVGAEIKSKTGTEDGALIADVIQSGVEGKIPAPAAKTENYTPDHDCRITFEFKAQGLKKIISDATSTILKGKGM